MSKVCPKCGIENADDSGFCACGQTLNGSTAREFKFCSKCGTKANLNAQFCTKCGESLLEIPKFSHRPVSMDGHELKSKMAAGLLGIFLGYIGVHRFYLGFMGIGIAQIAVTIITCGVGGIWGFIEGILILTGSMDKDANGNPLKD